MDEIAMVAELRPAQPAAGEADAMRTAVGGRLAGVLAGPAAPSPRPRLGWWSASRRGLRSASRRTRILIGTGVVAVGAAAAIVVPAVMPAGTGSPLVSKAWAVEHYNNGTVKLTVWQVIGDLSGLQAALRADGVPAVVAVIPWKITPGETGATPSCHYPPLPQAPAAVQRAVITHPMTEIIGAHGQPVGQQPAGLIWIFHPAAMPPGSVLFIEASGRIPHSTTTLIMSEPVVLRSAHLPACVPSRG